ncbi:MAG: malectin domain-containing carbohydrate-binding protein, partial [Acidimicrobiales bacterium]
MTYRAGAWGFAALVLAGPTFVGISTAAGVIVHRVNAGGPALAASPSWASDTSGSPSPRSNWKVAGNATFSTTAPVSVGHSSVPPGTPAALFQSERWDFAAAPEQQWDFPVTPGQYQVRLYFAEIYAGAQKAGARVFDVVIEGRVVLDDYDTFADVGGFTGVVKSFTVTAGANLDIDFGHVVQNPAVKGIEILRLDPPPTTTTTTDTTTTTSAPPPPPAANSRADAVSPFVSARGTELVRNGAPFRFTGVNAYQLATLWAANAGCGPQVDDIDGFFASLRPGSVVRFWAFESLAVNRSTGQRDFAGLDRVMAAAARRGQLVIPVLADHWGRCDGPPKPPSWYGGGFRQPLTSDGVSRTAFVGWVREVVSRYRNLAEIAMWEPVNEPELDCVAPAAVLRQFFDEIGAELRRVDPAHLISSGAQGGGQCGTSWEEYAFVHASPGIDVASYHDYHNDGVALPGDQWNGLAKRLDQSAKLAKPLVVGEAGLRGGPVAGCPSLAARAVNLTTKLTGQFAAGVRGFLPW